MGHRAVIVFSPVWGVGVLSMFVVGFGGDSCGSKVAAVSGG
jgi:hypothetical protein